VIYARGYEAEKTSGEMADLRSQAQQPMREARQGLIRMNVSLCSLQIEDCVSA